VSLFTSYLTQTCTIPDGESTQQVACRAVRAEGVGGGGFYYMDWTVYLEERVSYGDEVTVSGDVARTVYSVREVRDLDAAVVGYKVVLGHV